MVDVRVSNADVRTFACDILVMKHADGFYGADAAIADATGFTGATGRRGYAVVPGVHTEARSVMFVAVGPLHTFRYEQIRDFGRKALALAADRKDRIEHIALTTHGVGYGLDEREAFLSLLAGLYSGLDAGDHPRDLRTITVVELEAPRSERLARLLSATLSSADAGGRASRSAASTNRPSHADLGSFGRESERKPKLFVAMPFEDEFSDVWDVGISDACVDQRVLAEKINEQAFVGDIVTEIKKRVHDSNGLIAVLDGSNANVFLELGYAWALDKPTILVLRAGSEMPFDVRSQKCIMYKNMNDLRSQLKGELEGLKRQGVFDPL